MAKPQPYSPDEAKEIILIILRDGIVKPTIHCRQDSMIKRNITDDDVAEALEVGKVQHRPVWENKHQNWKYTVVGKGIEGDELSLITVIIESDLILRIITVW
jgi:Domain of unknown function (DUF4258)